MATVFYASSVRVPPDVAWDFLERYIRSKVHAFSACVSERQAGDFHVVTLAEGAEVRERNVAVDADRMRAVYTVPWVLGTEHHKAEMRVVPHDDGGAIVEWTTDIVPHELADVLREPYAAMFDELVSAVNRHRIEEA
jgi:Polyketide cyclase / dehydrase and lipid transport